MLEKRLVALKLEKEELEKVYLKVCYEDNAKSMGALVEP